MTKKYLKMNNNNNHLSLGNFCRLIKEQSLNKTYANQTDIFCTIFDLDSANDSTVNNYCLGSRPIASTFKEQYHTYRQKYHQNNKFMLPIILNLTSILDGYLYPDDYQKLSFLNHNPNLKKLCQTLYNLAKNDTTVPTKFTSHLHNLLIKNTYYDCLSEILFYIVLEKKQPLYHDNIITDTISNLLNNTTISLIDLEKSLNLQFKDGTNYIYSLKQLTKENNPYACFELGYLEYKGEITGQSRYLKSYQYLKIAASSNHPRANYLIAKMLLDQKIGSNTTTDINLAKKHLQTAIDHGSVAALNSIALLLLKEHKDQEAISYFEKATQSNYVYAYNNLGKIAKNNHDFTTAFHYYLQSANLEECWACNKIGEMYRLGLGTTKDLTKAYHYYNLALEIPINNSANWAKYNLAKYFYLNGNYEALIEKNYPKALNYLTEITANNFLPAQIELLYLYTDQYFTSHDPTLKNQIDILLNQIEQHPDFTQEQKQNLENKLLTIKKEVQINRNILLP